MSTQATLSSYFSQSTGSGPSTPSRKTSGKGKTGSTPIDLTLDSDDESSSPPRKRQRTTSSFFGSKPSTAHSPKAAKQAATSAGHAEQWRFDPASPAKSSRVTDDEKHRSSYERAKKILLGGDNIFNRRNHSDDAPPSFEGDDLVGDDNGQSEEEGENNAEKKFGELMEMFSSAGAKKKGKSSAKKAKPPAAGSSRSRSQKTEEIGPSGQTYTPFELQVGSITALAGDAYVDLCRYEI